MSAAGNRPDRGCDGTCTDGRDYVPGCPMRTSTLSATRARSFGPVRPARPRRADRRGGHAPKTSGAPMCHRRTSGVTITTLRTRLTALASPRRIVAESLNPVKPAAGFNCAARRAASSAPEELYSRHSGQTVARLMKSREVSRALVDGSAFRRIQALVRPDPGLRLARVGATQWESLANHDPVYRRARRKGPFLELCSQRGVPAR